MIRAENAARRTGTAQRPPEGIPPYDVRLRREITHRRLAVSLLRRLARVLSLHAVDGALLAGVVLLLAAARPEWAVARPLAPAIVATFLLGLNALAAYDPGDARRDRRRLASGAVLAMLILGCLTVFPPHLSLPPAFLALLAASSFLALALGRKVADLGVRQAYVRGIGLRRAVVVGTLDEVGRAIRELRDDRNIDQYVVGHLCPHDGPDPTALGAVSALPAVLDGMNVQEVLIATVLPPEIMRQVSAWCFDRGTHVFVIPSAVENADFWLEPMRVGACPVMRLHPARLEFPALLVKRFVDLVLATFALVVLSPLILLIAVAIRLDSPGPVFFRQRRVGLAGTAFTMWKFRSMAVGAEQREAELGHLNIYGERGTFKLREDPRVTRVGRFLRRTSMDELPQLVNVILGDMSIVGPRPALMGDINRYQPHHFERLTVTPGITGPWQVGGRNTITDFETVIQMERGYIQTWSLLLDLKIMVRTVKVVLSGEGAY